MMRLLATISLALLLMGCRAPTPSMNVFAPYGSATVPAPPTGTIGGSGGYYAPQSPATTVPNQPLPTQPPASPPPSTPGYGNLSPPATAGTALLGMSGEPTPAAGSFAVAQASFEPGSTAGGGSSSLRIKGHAGQRCHLGRRTTIVYAGVHAHQHRRSAARRHKSDRHNPDTIVSEDSQFAVRQQHANSGSFRTPDALDLCLAEQVITILQPAVRMELNSRCRTAPWRAVWRC